VKPSREGSITQWIFSENFCKCANPNILPPGSEPIQIESDVSDSGAFDEEYLDVNESDFPVDRYKPLMFIGKGALGEVYLCRDQLLRKKVAVKVLTSLTDDSIVSFQNEAKIASKLKHQNVIGVMDFGITNSGRPFMVMEYFPGTSLQDIIADAGKLDERDALDLFLPLCRSLQYLHDNGVLHRDLKPSNVLMRVTDYGAIDVRLIDFGLSKATQEVQSRTLINGNTIVGTPAYMSPDQIQGQPYNARSEIYSLGCLMYETVTGVQPFTGGTALEILNSHVRKPLPPLQDYSPSLSAELCATIEKCLAKAQENRFGCMSDVAESLTHVGAHHNEVLKDSLSESQIASVPSTKKASTTLLSIVIGLFVVLVPAISYLGVQLLYPSDDEADLERSKIIINSRDNDIRTVMNAEVPGVADIAGLGYKPLKTLSINQKGPITDRLEAKRFTKYDSVKLENCTITDTDLRLVASIGPARLILSRCKGDTNDILRGVRSINSLNTLSLNEVEGVTPAGLRYLTDLPDLNYLSLAKCGITHKHLKSLGELDTLQTLRLVSNEDVDMRGLRHLRHDVTNDPKNALGVRLDLEQVQKLTETFKMQMQQRHGVIFEFDSVVAIEQQLGF
jgi:serine/threonine protein kinase